MERTLDEVITTLSKNRRTRIEARFQNLKHEVESLDGLRQAAGKARAAIACALKIKPASRSKP